MAAAHQADALLIRRIREGDAEAWNELIGRFEGRLLQFVESRTRHRAGRRRPRARDVHRLLDQPAELRPAAAAGGVPVFHRRPQADRLSAARGAAADAAAGPAGRRHRAAGSRPARPGRPAASPAATNAATWRRNRWPPRWPTEVEHFRRRGQWERLECAELLFVRGWSNKETAARLGISEQTVANYKFEFAGEAAGGGAVARIAGRGVS